MKNYLRQMFDDNRLVELRCLSTGQGTYSGIYDSLAAFTLSARWANRCMLFKGVYALLNKMYPRHATNNLVRVRSTIKDVDIERITRLVFDIDPARSDCNKDQASTDGELSTARLVCVSLQKYLTANGFGLPLVAMSGNGWHLQYRIDADVSTKNKHTLSRLYEGLSRMFTCFDTTVRNPSRIFKLYGTTARKGTATDERPHRVARCKTPENWGIVEWGRIEQLADKLTPVVATQKHQQTSAQQAGRHIGQGDYCKLDVVGWFAAHGLYKRLIAGRKHAVTCPWLPEHSSDDSPGKTDTVIWQADPGWPEFHCSHSHCKSRGIKSVMEVWGDQKHFCK